MSTSGDEGRNRQVVRRYLEAFARTDREAILATLTDDVEWLIPGVVHRRGKTEFNEEIQSAESAGDPRITIGRLMEDDDVVVAEGTVQAGRVDGSVLSLAFCDVFEMQDGLIRRLISYLMPNAPARDD